VTFLRVRKQGTAFFAVSKYSLGVSNLFLPDNFAHLLQVLCYNQTCPSFEIKYKHIHFGKEIIVY